jgi:hypothetical protein
MGAFFSQNLKSNQDSIGGGDGGGGPSFMQVL